MKKLLLSFLTFTLASQAIANEYATQIFKQTEGVLAQKESAINLEQAKLMAVGENIEVQIAYERLLQAQRKISLARAQFFPYGLGDVGLIYFTNSFSALILVELITSIPTKWYAMAKEQHLRNAESWSSKALRENIKNQTALIYFNILKEESMVKLAGYELNLMEELLTARQAEVSVGLASADEVRKLNYRILSLRDELLKFEAYLAEEKAAFKMLLDIPYNAVVELQPAANFMTLNDYDVDAENLAQLATSRSYEIKAAEQVVQAAFDSKRSAQWSILSFSGIGFGYFSKIRMEGSKIEESKLRLSAIKNNIYNNTYSRKNNLQNSIRFFEAEKMVSDTTKSYVEDQLEAFNAGVLPLSDLIETELYFLRDYREMLQAHYSALTRLDDLERVILGNINESEISLVKTQAEDELSASDFSLAAEFKRGSVYFSIVDRANKISEVESVVYSFGSSRLNPIKSFRKQNDFFVKISQRKVKFPMDVKMQIILKSGDVINKTIRVEE